MRAAERNNARNFFGARSFEKKILFGYGFGSDESALQQPGPGRVAQIDVCRTDVRIHALVADDCQRGAAPPRVFGELQRTLDGQSSRYAMSVHIGLQALPGHFAVRKQSNAIANIPFGSKEIAGNEPLLHGRFEKKAIVAYQGVVQIESDPQIRKAAGHRPHHSLERIRSPEPLTFRVMKMKAAILEKLRAPLVLDEIEVPVLECGQVLVQIHRSGICGAQLGEIAGAKGEDKFLPHLLGHEGGGVVTETGPGVKHVRVGDHVVMHWRKGNGIQAETPKYRWGDRTVNSGWVTTFNEYAVISENRLTPIPKDIPFDVATLMGCAVTTALGLINNLARVKIGQSVAVIGCGGVGLNVVQGAAMVAADPVIAVDIYDHKLQLAQELGATHAINSARSDLTEEIKKIVGASGVDVFVENTGITKLIEQAYNLTSKSGKTILVGVPKHDQDITIHSLPLHFGKVLTGCEGGESEPAIDIPRYLRLYRAGKLKLDRVITHRLPFVEINTALEKVRAGDVGRCVLSMT